MEQTYGKFPDADEAVLLHFAEPLLPRLTRWLGRHHFFLGDNRDNANDSRFLGFAPEGDLRGRMRFVLHIGECKSP
jgi:hypothetical protein